MPKASTTSTLLTLAAVLLATTFANVTALAEEKQKQPGLWVEAEPDPPPASVVKAIAGLKSITVGELQSMEDYDLERLKDVARTSVDLISIEEKRRKDRGGRR